MASRGGQLQEAALAQSIGRLSRATGVAIDTIRFYERIGLLPAPRRTAAGYRMYSPADRRCPGSGDPAHCPSSAR